MDENGEEEAFLTPQLQRIRQKKRCFEMQRAIGSVLIYGHGVNLNSHTLGQSQKRDEIFGPSSVLNIFHPRD